MPKIMKKEKNEIRNKLKAFIKKMNYYYDLAIENDDKELFDETFYKVQEFKEQVYLEAGRILACLECGAIGLWKDLAKRIEYYKDVVYTHDCVNLSFKRSPADSVRTSWFKLRKFFKKWKNYEISEDTQEFLRELIKRTKELEKTEEDFDAFYHISDTCYNANIDINDPEIKRFMQDVYEEIKEE